MEKNASTLALLLIVLLPISPHFGLLAPQEHRHGSTAGRVHAGLGRGSLKMALRLHTANPIYENGVPKVAVDTTLLGLDGVAPPVKLGKLEPGRKDLLGPKHYLFLQNRVLPSQIFFIGIMAGIKPRPKF